MYTVYSFLLKMPEVWIIAVFITGLWNGVSEASSCSARGRFPNEKVANCRGYTMCLSGAPGIYTQYDLSCPETFVYSHIDFQCTNITSYQCHPQYNCTSEGNFAADTKNNCTMYIACIQGLDEIATARLVHCPEDTLFNPLEGTCVNSTMFNCHVDNPPSVLDAMPSLESGNSNTNNAVKLCSKYALLVYVMVGLAM